MVNFKFCVLSIGPQWADERVREQKEAELVQLNWGICYNEAIAGKTPKKPKDLYKMSVRYQNQLFASVAEASRVTKFSETHVRRMCRDDKRPDWEFIHSERMQEGNIVNMDKAKPISVNGNVYRSASLRERYAAKVLDIDRRTLDRPPFGRARSSDPKHDYCFYVESDSQDEA
jgi:hypothetical protein